MSAPNDSSLNSNGNAGSNGAGPKHEQLAGRTRETLVTDLPWQETDMCISEVHAYFGGKVCWLKNGQTYCGKPCSDPIHKIEYPPCEHSFICENCGEPPEEHPYHEACPKCLRTKELLVKRLKRFQGSMDGIRQAMGLSAVYYDTPEKIADAVKTRLLYWLECSQRSQQQ